MTIGKIQIGEAGRKRPGFSLIELLVVLAIIAVLLGILLSALSASRQAGLKLRCVSQMQEVTFEFRMFADEFAVNTRGESDDLGGNQFYLDDFQDYMYRIDEFWDIGAVVSEKYEADHEVMICPAGPRELYRRPNRTAFELAVWPPRNVSLAFNRRLWRDGINPGITTLSSRIMQNPEVPLFMDVDGLAADAAGRLPYYIAPGISGRSDEYSGNGFWFPSMRHNNKLNVAFIGGHVLSSEEPLREYRWRWDITAH